MGICFEINNYSNTLVYLHFGSVGVFLNFLSIIGIIGTSDFRTKNLFRYLLIKTMCDGLYLFTCLMTNIYQTCLDCFLVKDFASCQYGTNAMAYIGRPAAWIGMMCEVASNFNRYRVISSKFQFMDKIPFWSKISVMTLVSSAYFVYWIYGYDCHIIIAGNSNRSINEYFVPLYTDFYYSLTFQDLQLANRLIRDVICSFILVILNIITLIYMRQALVRKKRLTGRFNGTHHARAELAQTRTTQMVLFTSLLTLVGHVPMFITSLYKEDCFDGVAHILFLFPYSLNFFIYLVFLKNFQHFYKKIIFRSIEIVTLRQYQYIPSEFSTATENGTNNNINTVS